MTKQINCLKVFVASPSDVKRERVILQEVIDDINKIFRPRFGWEFELVKWETDTYPSIGKDAQSVINNQIGDDYDVLVGILWKRMGTTTKRSISGTVEEITRAYKRTKEIPDSVQLMVYFRNPPVSLAEVDVNQIAQIHEFKKTISDWGVYWWAYNSTRDFERHVRLHLQNTLLDSKDKFESNVKIEENVDIDDSKIGVLLDIYKFTSAEQVEQYILNLGESIADSLGLASQSAGDITKLMKLQGTRTGALADKLVEINNRRIAEERTLTDEAAKEHKERIYKEHVLPILDELSIEVEEFAAQAESQMPTLSSNFRVAIDRSIELASIASYVSGFVKERIQKNITALIDLKEADLGLIDNLKKYRAVHSGLMSRTIRLDISTAHLLKVADGLAEEYEIQVSLVTELLKAYENVLRYN